MQKQYLGDGAYVELEQGEVVLTTQNGIETTNRIVLGSMEMELLYQWYLRVTGQTKEE